MLRQARAFGTAIAVAAIVAASGAAPAGAAGAQSSTVRPTVNVAMRGGGIHRSTATRVDIRAAAQAATGQTRPQRAAPLRHVDLDAARGSTVARSSAGLTRVGGTPLTSTIQPRLVSGTTEQQVVSTFAGIEQADTCECEPPDPWIAVSPTYVVQSTNGKIRVSNRAGTQLVSMPTWAFFAVPADRADADPRILWDAVHGRWVGIITTFNGGFNDNGLRVAISDGADPTGSWFVYPIETGIYLPDYPGLSSSSSKIVFSSDDFDGPGFAGPSLYVIDWSAVLASGAISIGGYFEGPTRAHFRPAQMLSSGSSVPVIFEESGGHVGYLDVTYTAASISAIASGAITAFDLTANGPHVAAFATPADPVQPGPDSIGNAADERPTDAVYRSGHLWFVATTDYFDGANHYAAGRWTEVLTSVTNVLPTAAADWITVVSDHYFNPGVTISGNGTAFFVATRTDTDEYPTTVTATILPDGANLGSVVQDFIDVEASTESYTGNRWGDFLGVAADPSYNGAVWVEHELVAAGGGWRTGVARIVSDATPPTIPGAITQAFVTGSTLASTASVKVSWGAATDAGSGIGAYLVERSDAGGPFVGVTTTSTFLTQPITPIAVTVQYRVTPIDLLGNVGPTRTGLVLQPGVTQSTSSTAYSTGWGSSSSIHFSGGSTKYSSTAGKYATFTTPSNTRSIAIVSTKAASRGSFKVYVDGVYKGTISTYSTTTKYRQLVYSFTFASSGVHKVKIVVVGTAGHPRVDLDAFVTLRT